MALQVFFVSCRLETPTRTKGSTKGGVMCKAAAAASADADVLRDAERGQTGPIIVRLLVVCFAHNSESLALATMGHFVWLFGSPCSATRSIAVTSALMASASPWPWLCRPAC
eukprot:scaffold22307_cov126-Isochrysis_galbana.AAC.3